MLIKKSNVNHKDLLLKPSRLTGLSGVKLNAAWKSILESYNSKEFFYKVLASLFNALYTQNLPMFILSKKIIEDLIKLDKRLKRKTLDGKTYKYFLKRLINSGIIEVVESSSSFKEKRRRVGLYRVKDEELRQLFFEDIENRENELKEIYNKWKK